MVDLTHRQVWLCWLFRKQGVGLRGDGRTKTAHRGQIQVNGIPHRDFSKFKNLTQGEIKEEIDTTSSRSLPWPPYSLGQ